MLYTSSERPGLGVMHTYPPQHGAPTHQSGSSQGPPCDEESLTHTGLRGLSLEKGSVSNRPGANGLAARQRLIKGYEREAAMTGGGLAFRERQGPGECPSVGRSVGRSAKGKRWFSCF